MSQYTPPNYICPICPAAQGIENDHTWIVQDDVVYRDQDIFAFISSKKIEGNENHVLISPIAHYENLYEIPAELGTKIMKLSQRIAEGLKATRQCTGITTLQCNEPDGGQHAFHYHLHIVPRYPDDQFETALWQAQKCDPAERAEDAATLRTYLEHS